MRCTLRVGIGGGDGVGAGGGEGAGGGVGAGVGEECLGRVGAAMGNALTYPYEAGSNDSTVNLPQPIFREAPIPTMSPA